MTSYALLVRGINVGGRNKVAMPQLRQELADLQLDNVQTYINSGNIFFDSLLAREDLVVVLEAFFAQHYPFIQAFSLISVADYQTEADRLPNWWSQDLARKDVLFFTEGMDKEAVSAAVSDLELGDEIVHIGRLGIYWGKFRESSYSQTAYHKQLLKMPFYRQITIRNAKTFEKIGQLLK